MYHFEFTVIMEICSLLFFRLGFLLRKKEKISILHSYHYANVKDKDKKAYTAIMGKALVLIGLGMSLTGFLEIFEHTLRVLIPFFIIFAIGFGLMIYGQIKYNHGIFS